MRERLGEYLTLNEAGKHTIGEPETVQDAAIEIARLNTALKEAHVEIERFGRCCVLAERKRCADVARERGAAMDHITRFKPYIGTLTGATVGQHIEAAILAVSPPPPGEKDGETK